MLKIWLLLTLGLSQDAFLQPQFVNSSSYRSGVELCGALGQEWRKANNGKWILTRVSRDNQSQTPIFVHFDFGYDPSRPTVIVVDGGPGQSSHDPVLPFDIGYNVLRFDQRGVGCSRPFSFKQYIDPDFYGTDRTVSDMEAIRRHFGLERWSIWGLSYGTAVATRYASAFPEQTRALVLEGTIFTEQDDLWLGTYKKRLLQRLVDGLSLQDRETLHQVVKSNELPRYWFSVIANILMREHDPEARLKQLVKDLSDPLVLANLKQMFTVPTLENASPQEDAKLVIQRVLQSMDQTVFAQVGCRELSLTDRGLSLVFELGENLKIKDLPFSSREVFCKRFRLHRGPTFEAKQFPLRVPVTYFQGVWDGSTDAPFAIAHYKQVAKGPAQILLLRKGGHLSQLSFLIEGFFDPQSSLAQAQAQLLSLALDGAKIPVAIMRDTRLGWVKAEKNFPVAARSEEQ